MLRRSLLCLAGCALGFGVAACGGSSKAPGVVPAPSSGPTTAQVAAVTTPTTTTSTTPAQVTPPADLATKPAVTVPSGPAPAKLVVKDLIRGSGAPVKLGSTITVNYVGVLYKGGKEFDSSWKHGQQFTTPLTPTSIIPGWVIGLTGMRVGGRRELVIPPVDGYGKNAQPGIPANSTLVFVVDLLKVA
jgi:peptidylprolyl isomerase